jgi:hypothetical protein
MTYFGHFQHCTGWKWFWWCPSQSYTNCQAIPWGSRSSRQSVVGFWFWAGLVFQPAMPAGTWRCWGCCHSWSWLWLNWVEFGTFMPYISHIRVRIHSTLSLFWWEVRRVWNRLCLEWLRHRTSGWIGKMNRHSNCIRMCKVGLRISLIILLLVHRIWIWMRCMFDHALCRIWIELWTQRSSILEASFWFIILLNVFRILIYKFFCSDRLLIISIIL